jgi:hypothetical protein
LLLGLDGTPASCFHKKWSCKFHPSRAIATN